MKRFLYTFLFVIVSCLMLCVMASAVSIPDPNDQDENIKWEVTLKDYDEIKSDGDLIIGGSATIDGVTIVDGCYTQSGFNIPSYLDYNGKTYEVTAIGANAFVQKNYLVFGNLTLPKNLKEIGSSAFSGTRIYGVVDIPDSVTAIGASAFKNCKGITQVNLPDGFLSIANNTFEQCESLITVNSSSNLIDIGASAFYKCESLYNINIGKDTTTIGNYAFKECQALGGKIDLTTVMTLGTEAFVLCTNVEEFVLPEACFSSSAFSQCYKLKKFSYSEGVTSSDYYYIDEYGVLFNNNASVLYVFPAKSKVTEYTIPSSVKKIESYAFYKANKLVYVNIPDNTTAIGDYAFAWSSLETLYIPDEVSSVGSYILQKCENMKWVVLGSKVAKADKIFDQCSFPPSIVIYKCATFSGATTSYINANSYMCTTHFFGYRGVPATCTTSGENECVVCKFRVYAKATGHSGTIVEISELSCTTDAYTVYDCPECDDPTDPNYPYATLIHAKSTGHTATPEIIEATSTTPGYTVLFCTTCNETAISDYTASFFKLGDINNDGYVTSLDVTFLTQYLGGVPLYINAVSCDLNQDKVIDIYDLIILKRCVEALESVPTGTPTCATHIRTQVIPVSVSGNACITGTVDIIYCCDCGLLIDCVKTAPKGHTWKFADFEPSCRYEGRVEKTCSVCATRVTETIEKIPHSGEWWTIPGQKDYQYRYCTAKNCGVLDCVAVDYSEFEKILGLLSPNYVSYFSKTELQQEKHAMYYDEDTLALLEPIMNNYNLALTQDLVDQNTAALKEILPRLQYNVNGVPSIYITTDGSYSLVRNMPYIGAEIVVAYYDENGNYVDYIERYGQMKVRGNSTADSGTKKPFNIKFNTDIDLFGLGADNKYCLMANAYEPTMMRNAMARYFNELIGLDYYCKFEFVDVYCDNVFKGSYMLCTPVDIEETRININEDSDFILEVENQGSGVGDKNALYIKSPYTNFSIKIDSHDKEEISASGYSSLYSTFYQADFALMSGDWEQIQKYFDVDSLARYYILHEYLKDVDYAWDSTRFCLVDGKITAGPAWDFDRAIGHAKQFNSDGSRVSYYNYTERNSIGGVVGDGATGVWANVFFEGMPRAEYDSTNTTPDKLWINNPTSSNFVNAYGNNNNWFTFLYLYSPEFMDLVTEYLWEYRDLLVVMYADTTDELGNVTTNFIDSLYKDTDFYESVLRNYQVHSLWSSTAEGWNFSTYTAAIAQLRTWLANRYDWMINFYCFEYLEAEKATALLKQYSNNKLNATTEAYLSKVNGEFVYTVDIDAPSDFGCASHFDDMCKLIKSSFSYFEKVTFVFNYNLGSKTTTLTKEIVNENPDSFTEMRLDLFVATLTTDKTVNKHADDTTVTIDGNNVTVTIAPTDTSDFYKNGSLNNDLVKSNFNTLYAQVSKYLYSRDMYDTSRINLVFKYNFDNGVTKTVYINKSGVQLS